MYLIIGGNGFLGSYIIKAILENTSDDIIATARAVPACESKRISWKKCDITNFEDVNKLSEYVASSVEPYKVIFLAAYHHPDMVEKNPKAAWNTNITSLSYFLNRIENVKTFFYPSSDSVYGDSIQNKHFDESSILHPVNRYGVHKMLAEQLVVQYGYNVVRYPFLIGPSLLKEKKHFYDHIVSTIINGDKIDMFSDSYRSSLDFATAAYLLIRLIESDSSRFPNIINISGDEDLSKYDIGLMIAEKYGIPKERVNPILAEKSEGIFKVKRAKSTLMNNTLLKELLQLSEIKINI